MVMGIFMCSCLVGALWYLAGIGDAILYRERLQEAADAMAFSDAALHARGMNLLVLINLIMSLILGIRVAIRTAKIVTLIATAVFANVGLSLGPHSGWVPSSFCPSHCSISTSRIALGGVSSSTTVFAMLILPTPYSATAEAHSGDRAYLVKKSCSVAALVSAAKTTGTTVKSFSVVPPNRMTTCGTGGE